MRRWGWCFLTQKPSPIHSAETRMSNSGYPIAIGISNDGSLVAVSYIKVEKGKMVSNIGFYNFSAVGQNYTDNFVSGYVYPEAVIPIVNFMGSDTVFAVADNRRMFFKGIKNSRHYTIGGHAKIPDRHRSLHWSDHPLRVGDINLPTVVITYRHCFSAGPYLWSINLSGALFTYSNDGMNCTDLKGKTIWNQTYEMQNLCFCTWLNRYSITLFSGK